MEFERVINIILKYLKIFIFIHSFIHNLWTKISVFIRKQKGNSGYYCGLYVSHIDIKNRKLQPGELMSIFFNCVI